MRAYLKGRKDTLQDHVTCIMRAAARGDKRAQENVRTLMACLPPEEKQVIRLRVVDRHRVALCAKEMGVSTQGVDKLTRAAIEKMADELREGMLDEMSMHA